MIRALLELLARLAGRRPNPWADDVDLVPAACDDCGNPIAYCDCAPGLVVPHDLSDYDDYAEAARQKCQGRYDCSVMTTLLAGDAFPDTHDGPAVPMCLACQALLDEAAAR